jgi:DNA primase
MPLTDMSDWLNESLLSAASSVSEAVEGYVLGRGLPERTFRNMGIGVWEPPATDAPFADFRQKFGARGEHVAGWLSIPVRSPRGALLGVEFRRWDGEKAVRKYHLADASWNPLFHGEWPVSLHKIWQGGDVWLVEGIFDMCISRIVPDRDVVLATGGAAVSRQHLDFLSRFLSSKAMLRLTYDNDETGQRQATGFYDDRTKRQVPSVPDRFRRVGVNCTVTRYAGGKDPGEIWERGGYSALRAAFRI